MNNKRMISVYALTILFAIVLCSILIYYAYGIIFGKNQKQGKDNGIIVQNTDYSVLASDNIIKGNEKIIIESYYKDCGHSQIDEINPPNQFAGLTIDEFMKKNEGAVLKSKTSEQIEIVINRDGKCNNHFVAKEYQDKIGIFYENNNELYQIININIKELPTADLEMIKNGVILTGKDELMQFIEDYTS